jgi:hypothetical protein
MVVDRRGNIIAATVAGCNVNRPTGGDVSMAEAEDNLRAIEQIPETQEILTEMLAMIRECPRSYCMGMARRIEGFLQTHQMMERAELSKTIFEKSSHPGMDDTDPDYGF